MFRSTLGSMLVFLSLPAAAQGAESPAASAPGSPAVAAAIGRDSLQFRRVFVPADRVSEVTDGDDRFLPVPRHEFEALVGDTSAGDRANVHVDRAVYRAELDGDRLVRGSAELVIAHTGDQPAWLELETSGMASHEVRWGDGRPCRAGTYFADNSSQARHGVIVAAGGTLSFSWTASGQRVADGTEFRLSFPEASASECVLVVPATVQVTAQGASVREVARNEAAAVEYRLALRGGAPLAVTIHAPLDQAQPSAFALRQATSYRISPSGVQVEARMRISPFYTSSTRFTLRCDAGVQVVDATLGGQPLPFTPSSSVGEDGRLSIDVALASPLPPGETELRVRAMAATKIGQIMAIPTIELDRSTWLEGTVHVELDEGLHVRELIHDGLRPEARVPAAVAGQRQWTLTQSNPQATLKVRVARPPTRLSGRMLTTATIDPEKIAATAILDLESDDAAESIVRAVLSPGWQLLSVETEPAGGVRSWSTQRVGPASSMHVVLEQPVAPQNPVRLRIGALRRRESTESPLEADELLMLRFDPLNAVDQWMEVVPGPSLAMVREGRDPVLTVTKDEIPVLLADSVSDRRDGFLFAVDQRLDNTRFALRSRAAEFTGDVEIRAHVTDADVKYRCRFSIEPQSGEVSRVGIVLSSAIAELATWRFTDASGRAISAVREPQDSETGDDASVEEAGRTFRWQLATPQIEPFELEVSFAQQRADALPLILAAIETSRSQSAVVYLSRASLVRIAIENRALDPFPVARAPAADPEFRGEVVHAYQYQPERVVLAEGVPPLVIRQLDAAGLAPLVWVRAAKLESAYLPHGEVINHLTLQVERQGSEQIEIDLPHARRILYRVGGDSWRHVSSPAGGGPIAIPLLGTSVPTVVEVRFWGERPPLGGFATIRPPPVQFSVPVSRIAIRAWLPHEYRVVQPDHPAQRLLAGLHAVGGGLLEVHRSPIDGQSEFDHGLTAWELPTPSVAADTRATLSVIHSGTIRLWCIALLAAGMLAGTVLARVHPGVALAGAVVALAGALVVPDSFVAQVSALAWGALAAVLLRRVRHVLQAAWRRAVPVEGELARTVVTAGAVLLLGGVVVHECSAAAAASAAEPMRAIPRVVDPIAEGAHVATDGAVETEPFGPHVLVPESLYASLLKRARDLRAPVGEWLLANCRIRGGVTGDAQRLTLSPSDWRITLQLETFHRDALVRLPLSRAGAQWHTEAFRLDGAKANSWFSDDGLALVVRVPEPGSHDLELPVTPRLGRAADSTELALPLASVRETTLDLSVSADLPPAKFAGVGGDVRYVPVASAFRGNLGPVRELVMSWPAENRAPRPGVPVDLLTWMHVGRSSTFIEQRLVVHVDGAQTYFLEVVPPRGVRYLPSANELSYARVSLVKSAGSSMLGEAESRVLIAVTGDGPESLPIPLQFVMDHSAATTTVPVVRMAVEGDVRAVSRLVALQAAGDARIALVAGTTAEAIELEEFMSRWGLVDAPPDVAYREPAIGHAWRVSIQSDDALVNATEAITAVAQPTGIDVQYRCDCRVERGAVLVHRIDKPEGLAVAEVEVEQGNRPLPVDWAQTRTGELEVFLPEPTSGAHVVSLRGTIAADRQGNVRLALPSFEAAQRATVRLTTARTAGTTLEIDESERLMQDPGASFPADWQDEWYLHGHYTLTSPPVAAVPLAAKVGAASPPSDAHDVLTVRPNQGGWEASLHLTAHALREPLDRIVLIAPKDWQGPYELEPSGRWRLSVLEEARHNRIILRPRQPTGGDVLAIVRGQLARDRQDLVAIPNVRVVEPPSGGNRVVALARAVAGQAVQWLPQGLQPLPADEAAAIGTVIGVDANEWTFFRDGEAAPPASARISIIEPSATAPHVSLMEASALVGSDQRILLEATFTLDPRGRRTCEALLSQGYRLLDARVNGRRQFAWQAAPRRWQLQLESSQLPQWIQLSCQRDVGEVGTAQAADAVDIRSPVLLVDGVPVPVVQTAWQVQSDRAWRLAGPEPDALTEVSGPMLAAVRLANLVETLDEIVPALLGSPAENWTAWLDFWRGQVALAEGAYDRRAAAMLDGPSEIRTVDDAAGAAALARQKLQQMASLDEALPSAARVVSGRDGDKSRGSDSALDGGGIRPRFSRQFLSDDRGDVIRLEHVDTEKSYTAERVLGSILLSLIALGSIVVFAGGPGQGVGARPVLYSVALLALAILAIVSGSLWAIVGGLFAAGLVYGWDSLRGRLIARGGV